MALTLERIEALAPDQASLAAARKLLKPGGWPTLAAADGLSWGECQGSGATPYRVVVSEADAGYKCTCPSRKFPCKHSLALMWMRAEGKLAFTPAPVPEWVKDWLGRRRGAGPAPAPASDKPTADPGSGKSILLTQLEDDTVSADPKAEARAAAARERNRLDREASILGGLDELDVWLTDQVERGIAGFVAQSGQVCRLIAQRLVDAKAAGLASRIESLPAHLFTLPEQVRPAAAVQELGQMHLLAAAYRRQDALPPALKADVRQAVGWTVTREALLADANALRVAATWRVVAVESEVQPDRLRRVETWLWREGSGDAEPRCAVLIDFVPVATGAASGGYLAGDRIVAELAFYPSAAPLRAQLAEVSSGAQRCEDDLDLGGGSFGNAFEQFESSLGKLPWLGRWPLGFAGARVRRAHDSLYLCDTETAFAVPLHPAQASLALPLAGLDSIDGIGLWNGYYLTMCWAQTELGRWVNA